MKKAYQTEIRTKLDQLLEAHPQGIKVSELVSLTQANKATVYRYINELVDQKKVMLIDSTAILTQEDCQHHLHVKCRQCGQVIHLACHQVEALLNHLQSEHQFELDLNESLFIGVCHRCQSKR